MFLQDVKGRRGHAPLGPFLFIGQDNTWVPPLWGWSSNLRNSGFVTGQVTVLIIGTIVGIPKICLTFEHPILAIET